MSYIGWENNRNGICEDAPCCGCCGPQGDGVIYDEPPEPYDDYDTDVCECEDCTYERGDSIDPAESPDPNWMNP